MAIRKITENTDIYSFETQIPKMVNAFLNAGVIDKNYAREINNLLTMAINKRDNAVYNLGEHCQSTENSNNVQFYANKVENLYAALNTYFQRLRVLYKRIFDLDKSNPRYKQRIADTIEDVEEDTKEFQRKVYDA